MSTFIIVMEVIYEGSRTLYLRDLLKKKVNRCLVHFMSRSFSKILRGLLNIFSIYSSQCYILMQLRIFYKLNEN